MLTRTGRLVRALATAAVVTALVAGTLWGEDDHFPFGPFRMYAVTTSPNGPVSSLRLEGETEDGEELVIRLARVGLRRAELQGQMVRFWDDDRKLLSHIAGGWSTFQPDAPRLAELRLVYRIHLLRNGAVIGDPRSETVAVWRRP